MNQRDFFNALEEMDDAFFIWNHQLRTRVHGNKESVDPIIAVARYLGFKGKDMNEAITYLELDSSFAIKIAKIAEGEGVYTPEDLKIKAKLFKLTVKKYIH